MLKFLLLFVCYLSASLYADSGVVIKVNVCGSDNIIIETSDGWYTAAEWYGGHEFDEEDVIYGDLKAYGFKTLYDQNGNEGRYWIEDYESSIGGAFEELCD